MVIDDHEIGALNKQMQVKLGGLLSNLMCKTLKYKIGKREYLLLKPQTVREGGKKYHGYMVFNKAFVEKFVSELDKIHDLNLQMERSLPMIYTPAPWKNYYFGGYYLKQTKLAKVHPNFREAIKYMHRADLSSICKVLNNLGNVEWRVNKKILDQIEYMWANEGGLASIPNRFNERTITPEMIREATF